MCLVARGVAISPPLFRHATHIQQLLPVVRKRCPLDDGFCWLFAWHTENQYFFYKPCTYIIYVITRARVCIELYYKRCLRARTRLFFYSLAQTLSFVYIVGTLNALHDELYCINTSESSWMFTLKSARVSFLYIQISAGFSSSV